MRSETESNKCFLSFFSLRLHQTQSVFTFDLLGRIESTCLVFFFFSLDERQRWFIKEEEFHNFLKRMMQ